MVYAYTVLWASRWVSQLEIAFPFHSFIHFYHFVDAERAIRCDLAYALWPWSLL